MCSPILDRLKSPLTLFSYAYSTHLNHKFQTSHSFSVSSKNFPLYGFLRRLTIVNYLFILGHFHRFQTFTDAHSTHLPQTFHIFTVSSIVFLFHEFLRGLRRIGTSRFIYSPVSDHLNSLLTLSLCIFKHILLTHPSRGISKRVSSSASDFFAVLSHLGP